MADDFTAAIGGVPTTFAADDVGGKLHQRVKLSVGADGAAADVHSGNPLPVSGPLTDTQLRATALPLPAGAATSAKQDAITAAIQALVGSEYEAVAASQANQVLGGSGAAGDLLVGLLVIPASTSPGAVSIADGGGAAMTVFAGGAASVATLHPFPVQLGIRSATGGWRVTTGAGVSVIAVGNFT